MRDMSVYHLSHLIAYIRKDRKDINNIVTIAARTTNDGKVH